MPQKDSAEKAIRDIRRKARRKFSAEEKTASYSGVCVVRIASTGWAFCLPRCSHQCDPDRKTHSVE
jgi:hypothetical protein